MSGVGLVEVNFLAELEVVHVPEHSVAVAVTQFKDFVKFFRDVNVVPDCPTNLGTPFITVNDNF